GGTIDTTTGDGMHSADSNLTLSGVNIGGTGLITGDGVEIVSSGSVTHTINLTSNTINGFASGISSSDSGSTAEILLTMDGNTIQAGGAGAKAISITGSGADSTIITSMSGGTVLGNGNGGGVLFNNVTFDASGAALSGTQVDAGTWTIGTSTDRIQG